MRALTTALTALGVLLLAGCGGNPEASPPPTPSATASPSPSASATATEPPEMPPAVRLKNEKGAKATVRWFLQSMDYAGETGDAAAFRATFARTCTKCRAIADGIESTYADGGSITGGAWRPFGFKFYGISDDVATLDAAVNYEPQVFKASSTATPENVPGQKNVLKAFQLVWTGSWTVGALDPEL